MRGRLLAGICEEEEKGNMKEDKQMDFKELTEQEKF